MSETPLKTCPKCGKDTLKRLIGAGSGVIFKGSGFYLTDYKKTDKEKPAGKKEETPKKTETPKEKTETKTETNVGKKTDKDTK
jgi:predicted nucleic acid-binding Zn ribbon protein